MKGIIRSFSRSEHDRQKNTSLQFGEETLENQPLVLAEDSHLIHTWKVVIRDTKGLQRQLRTLY